MGRWKPIASTALAFTLTVNGGQLAADQPTSLVINPPENAPNAALADPFGDTASPGRFTADEARPLASSEEVIVASQPGERPLRWRSPAVPADQAELQSQRATPSATVFRAPEAPASPVQGTQPVRVTQHAEPSPAADGNGSSVLNAPLQQQTPTQEESPQRLDVAMQLELDPPSQPELPPTFDPNTPLNPPPALNPPPGIGTPQLPPREELPAPPRNDPPSLPTLPPSPGQPTTPGEVGPSIPPSQPLNPPSTQLEEPVPPVERDPFHGRNTTEEQAHCADSLERLQRRTLASLDPSFLDITPRYNVSSLNHERNWVSTEGGNVAVGWLADYQSGQVTVEDRDGNRTTFDANRLHARDRQFLDGRLARLNNPPSVLREWHTSDGRFIAHGQLVDYRNRQVTILSSDGESFTAHDEDLSDADRSSVAAWLAISLPNRPWHDRDGNHIAQGELIDHREDQVTLATHDGETFSYPYRMLSEADKAYISAAWELPTECLVNHERYTNAEQYELRPWTEVTYFTWKASALCHKPLYFEDFTLERYGHSARPCTQPLLSGAHFFLNVAILPYRMGMNPPQECQYSLGYYRPGNCAPWMIPAFPWSVRGGLVQASVATGLPIILP